MKVSAMFEKNIVLLKIVFEIFLRGLYELRSASNLYQEIVSGVLEKTVIHTLKLISSMSKREEKR